MLVKLYLSKLQTDCKRSCNARNHSCFTAKITDEDPYVQSYAVHSERIDPGR